MAKYLERSHVIDLIRKEAEFKSKSYTVSYKERAAWKLVLNLTDAEIDVQVGKWVETDAGACAQFRKSFITSGAAWHYELA